MGTTVSGEHENVIKHANRNESSDLTHTFVAKEENQAIHCESMHGTILSAIFGVRMNVPITSSPYIPRTYARVNAPFWLQQISSSSASASFGSVAVISQLGSKYELVCVASYLYVALIRRVSVWQAVDVTLQTQQNIQLHNR